MPIANILSQPLFYVHQLVLVTAVAGLCLLAIWAGLSRRHWFLRAAAVWVGIVALLPIRADGPLQMFLFVLPATAVAVLFLRRVAGPPADASCRSTTIDDPLTGRLRYGLRDLFLGVLLAGIVVATAMAAWRTRTVFSSLWMFASGGCLVVLAVLSTAVVLVQRKRAPWIAALAGSVAGTAALHTWIVPDWLGLECAYSYTVAEQLLGFAIAFAEFCGLLVVTLALARIAIAEPGAPQRRWRKSAARGLLLAQAAVFLFPLAVVYCHMLQGPRLPQQSFGSANNYPQLLAAVQKLQTLNSAELSVGELQRQASTAGAAKQVAELHTTLLALVEQPGYVPFGPAAVSGLPLDWGMPPADVMAFRAVARMWRTEAEAAAKAGRFDEAARYGMATVRMGNTLSRGGFVLNVLIGVGLEDIGRESLRKIRGDVTPTRARAVLTELDRIEQARDPVEAAIAREAVWYDDFLGWLSRFQYAMARVTRGTSEQWWGSDPRPTTRRRDAWLRLLQTDLAVRLFRQECGRLPQQLDELVPKYLAAVPIDPFSDQPLVYRCVEGQYVLYSVGPDGVDNGGTFGRPGDYGKDGYDLDLDYYDR
jgi:hypothetical protein